MILMMGCVYRRGCLFIVITITMIRCFMCSQTPTKENVMNVSADDILTGKYLPHVTHWFVVLNPNKSDYYAWRLLFESRGGNLRIASSSYHLGSGYSNVKRVGFKRISLCKKEINVGVMILKNRLLCDLGELNISIDYGKFDIESLLNINTKRAIVRSVYNSLPGGNSRHCDMVFMYCAKPKMRHLDNMLYCGVALYLVYVTVIYYLFWTIVDMLFRPIHHF